MVGRNMGQWEAEPGADQRDLSGKLRIDVPSQCRLGLASFDAGQARRVNDDIGLDRLQCARQRVDGFEVQDMVFHPAQQNTSAMQPKRYRKTIPNRYGPVEGQKS